MQYLSLWKNSAGSEKIAHHEPSDLNLLSSLFAIRCVYKVGKGAGVMCACLGSDCQIEHIKCCDDICANS